MTTGRTLTVEIYPGPLFVYATLTTATGITCGVGWVVGGGWVPPLGGGVVGCVLSVVGVWWGCGGGWGGLCPQ